MERSSVIQKIFDPLGIFAPALIISKICIPTGVVARFKRLGCTFVKRSVYEKCAKWFVEAAIL
jgi:hypothetical protein